VVAAAWLIGVLLLGAADVFRNDALPPRIPMALGATLLPGYLLLLSPAFRRIVAAVPQHWLIGIQRFRIMGSALLVRYFAGQLPGLFALPAGIGDVATGLLAPFVAYAWYTGKPYARGAAIAWNVFGMADLINAVALGALTGGGEGGIVFPLVLIPAYGVPRAFLIHSYSTDRPPAQNFATAAARGVVALRDGRRSRMNVTPRAKARSFAASLRERHQY
jgi:hypothetical protein